MKDFVYNWGSRNRTLPANPEAQTSILLCPSKVIAILTFMVITFFPLQSYYASVQPKDYNLILAVFKYMF